MPKLKFLEFTVFEIIVGRLNPSSPPPSPFVEGVGKKYLRAGRVKICDIEIVKLLYLIYMKCLETGRFSSSWKKANLLLIHKKENRQLTKNYTPISLLPICGKIFEKPIFDTIYEYIFTKINS